MHTKGKLEAIGSQKAKFKDAFFVRIAGTRDGFVFKAYGHTGEDSKANATELVRRWNAFPELLEAYDVALITLKDIRGRHTKSSFHNNRVESDANDAINILQAAIKAVESEV